MFLMSTWKWFRFSCFLWMVWFSMPLWCGTQGVLPKKGWLAVVVQNTYFDRYICRYKWVICARESTRCNTRSSIGIVVSPGQKIQNIYFDRCMFVGESTAREHLLRSACCWSGPEPRAKDLLRLVYFDRSRCFELGWFPDTNIAIEGGVLKAVCSLTHESIKMGVFKLVDSLAQKYRWRWMF